MNKLKRDKQEAVIRCLVNGSSVRATERMTGVHRDTILRLMVRTGDNCRQIMDSELRGLNCRHVQMDEIWAMVGKKQRRLTEKDDPSRMGDFWTFVALDSDTRLVPATEFVADLESRLDGRVQLSTDGLKAYVEAIDTVFGANVDYAQIVKSYEAEAIGPGRYSPPRVKKVERTPILGRPDMRQVSTSYVERSNLLMRMSIRRMTRLTDAFSRKLENFEAAIALHFAYYNFVRIHKSLKVTPAMAAGVSDRIWSLSRLLA